MDYQEQVDSNIKIVEHNDTYVICAGRKAMETLQLMGQVYMKHSEVLDETDIEVWRVLSAVYVP